MSMIKILWSWDYWDGPLSGLCLYNGRAAWFSNFALGGWCGDDDVDCWAPRVYRVYRLSWFEAKKLMLGHWIFQKTVGSRRMTRAWYNGALPLFRHTPGQIIGAFSDSECFGR